MGGFRGKNRSRQPGRAGGLPVAQSFQTALNLHLSGNNAAARGICEAILGQSPRHFDALHLLGVLACQEGRFADAEALFQQAITIKPNHAPLHAIRGDTLQELGRHGDAVASYDRTIALQPDFARAYAARAEALMAVGLHDQAAASCNRAITLQPGLVEAHINLGNALKELGRYDEAIRAYDRAISLDPRLAVAYCNRGLVLHQMGRFRDAADSFERAIQHDPNLAEAHYNLGNAAADLRQYADAVCCYDRAIARKPDYPEAHANRGNALLALGRAHEARDSYDHAIQLRPDWAEAYYNRGNAFRELTDLDSARVDFSQAIALDPGHAKAYSNRGMVLLEAGRYEAAIQDFDAAIALRHDYAEALWNKALARLTLGAFDDGWNLYEWRKRLAKPSGTSQFPQPVWDGRADLSDKTLLVYHEQGLGDTIQFARYVKCCVAKAAHVVLTVQTPLVDLLKWALPDVEVVDSAQLPPHFDYQCALLSLPRVFNSQSGTIPADPAYVTADPERVAVWRQRMASCDRPRIGLVWSGYAGQKHDRTRSMALRDMEPLLTLDAEWHTLQTEIRDTDRARLPHLPQLRVWQEEIVGFASTAALVAHLDLVVTVDTSLAHLAGAMGKPTWILLPYAADWRWLLNRTDSPWYPSVRLYRQQTPGDWPSLIDTVRRDLAGRFALKRDDQRWNHRRCESRDQTR